MVRLEWHGYFASYAIPPHPIPSPPGVPGERGPKVQFRRWKSFTALPERAVHLATTS